MFGVMNVAQANDNNQSGSVPAPIITLSALQAACEQGAGGWQV